MPSVDEINMYLGKKMSHKKRHSDDD